jgi:hypothetical protein
LIATAKTTGFLNNGLKRLLKSSQSLLVRRRATLAHLILLPRGILLWIGALPLDDPRIGYPRLCWVRPASLSDLKDPIITKIEPVV